MLSVIISYLITRLEDLNYLDKVAGLASTIKRDGVKLTGYYQQGELVPIDFDQYFSLVFFVQNGKVTRETTEDKYTACRYRVKEVYNLSLMLCRQGGQDVNCFSQAQNMAWHIAQQLTGKQYPLMAQTGLDEVTIRIRNIGLDSDSIYEALFSGESRLTENTALLEINFEVETEGDEQCYVTYPCAVSVQGDGGSNQAFGTNELNEKELINGNL